MAADWYKWSEFKALVRSLMPLESQRLGLQDVGTTPGYISLQINQAVIDLQNYIGAYRKNHEDIYLPSDLVTDGEASRGACPPGAILKEFWIYNGVTRARYPAHPFPFERRYELINGQVSIDDQHARIATDDHGETFWVFPKIEGDLMLAVLWDGMGESGGIKLEFKEDELVPFEEDAAQAVADYVKANLAREVDKNLQDRESYQNSYLTKRKELHLRHKNKAIFK